MTVNLAGTTAPAMRFDQWYRIETRWDGGNVKVLPEGSSTWELLGSYVDGPYNEDEINSSTPLVGGQPGFYPALEGPWFTPFVGQDINRYRMIYGK